MPSLVSHPDEVKVVSRRFGMGAANIEKYIELDGYKAVQKAIAEGPEWIINTMKASGLRGRGGAGFPTALKMHAVAAAGGRSRSVAVNAVEGEPASLKDETLLATAPHLVLDGAVLAAQALGAGEAVLCVSEESPHTLQAAADAIAERAGLSAEPALSLAAVPHTFVAGQESALVSHLNGGEAKPTFTPPMVFERGLHGRPTLLSNGETFAHLALIARHGADWFRAVGTAAHPGSALVTLSGPVAYPGVYEIEHGSSLRSLLDAAGGQLEELRAVLVGGYAGTWLDARDAAAMTIDDGWLARHEASTGAGVIALLGAGACGVAEIVRVTRWLAAESAAQCGPCVHGLAAISARLEGWAWGGERSNEQELLRLASVIRGRGACRHPDGTLRFLASAMQVFAEELAEHSLHGPCDACSAPGTLPLPRSAERRPAAAGGAR
jgi:NADH:ubiquinone oxidoreductase subunit F (NADH-binding)